MKTTGQIPPGDLHNRDESDGFSVIGCGVHTVSYAFRGLSLEQAAFDGPRLDRDSDQFLVPFRSGHTTTLSVRDNETKLGLITTPRGDALVFCDSTLGTLLGQKADLVANSALVAGEVGARDFADRVGVRLDGCESTVRRCDLACDVAFDASASSFTFLRAMRNVVLPCLKIRTEGARGTSAIETVSWSNRSGVQLRIYDKSAQRHEHARAVVRIERQWRPPARKQITSSEMTRVDLGAEFSKPFRCPSIATLVVAHPLEAYHILKSRVGMTLPGRKEDGAPRILTPRIAERMLGTMMQLLVEGDDAWDKPRTARQRRTELLQVSIAIDEAAESVIDVGSVLSAAVASWRSTSPIRETPRVDG